MGQAARKEGREIEDCLWNSISISRREPEGESKRGKDPERESSIYPDDSKATLNGTQV